MIEIYERHARSGQRGLVSTAAPHERATTGSQSLSIDSGSRVPILHVYVYPRISVEMEELSEGRWIRIPLYEEDDEHEALVVD